MKQNSLRSPQICCKKLEEKKRIPNKNKQKRTIPRGEEEPTSNSGERDELSGQKKTREKNLSRCIRERTYRKLNLIRHWWRWKKTIKEGTPTTKAQGEVQVFHGWIGLNLNSNNLPP